MLLRRKLFLSGVVLLVLLCSSLVVSVDAALMWSQTYGGAGYDFPYALVAASDGGYAIAGVTNSFGAGGLDFWLVKTDAFGHMEWNKTFGGTGDEGASSMVATSDGGYAIAGSTFSYDTLDRDFWLVKTDASGNMEWNKTYGGTASDGLASMVATSDGGFAMTGLTYSFGAHVGTGWGDIWLIKTDSAGNIEWNQTYGGYYAEEAYSVVSTSDGGYALIGITCNVPSLEHTPRKFLLVKTDAYGNMEWNQTYGESSYDEPRSLVATSDGGYAIVGYTYAFDGYGDFLLIKTAVSGNMEWNRTYGNPGSDLASELVETSGGGYAIAGYTTFEHGVGDMWVIKTDLYGNVQWNQTYGGTAFEGASSLVETSDGGYAIAGVIAYPFDAGFDDFWLVKTDEFGVVQEYSSWLIPAIVLTTTAFIITNKKRLLRKRSQKPQSLENRPLKAVCSLNKGGVDKNRTSALHLYKTPVSIKAYKLRIHQTC
jgi:hypothetical protein